MTVRPISFYDSFWPLIVLAISLTATYFVTTMESRVVERNAADYFNFRVDDALERIGNRLRLYQEALRGSQALFISSGNVSRDEFRNYVSSLDMKSTYPGIQGIGYSVAISRAKLAQHIDSIRKEGFPGYTVRPAGNRDFYTAIVYLEPFDWRNKRAFGYDMYSEPVRREAMQSARDTGRMTMSGKVTLVQETGMDVQPGFLMYLPVYRAGAAHATMKARQANLQGWVYSVFRMGDLMSGIFGTRSNDCDIRVYDGDYPSENSLMYDTNPGLITHSRFLIIRKLQIANHAWSIRISSLPAMEARLGSSNPTWIAGGGLLISLLLTLVTWMLVSGRRRSMALALELNRDLVESRKELQRENEKNLALLRNASDGIHILDIDGKIIEASDSFCQMLGYARDEILGMNIFDIDAGFADSAAILSSIRQQLDSHTRSQFETLHKRKDGTIFEVEVSGMPLELDGRLVLFNSSRDITERKRVEKMKNEFVSTVSHELRTPLTSISGTLGLLAGGVLGELPDAVRDLVDIANRNSLRLTHLINDLLDIEKIASGKLKLNMRDLELMTLVEQALEENKSYADQYRVSYVLGERADGVRVRADADRLMQVLANFLSNAAKFSPEGDQVEVRVARENGRVRVTVRDHGPGIPEEFRSRIFQKFSQADSSDTRTKGGTGLGLAISRELAERMGGEVGFESEPGQGSAFYIEFPEKREVA